MSLGFSPYAMLAGMRAACAGIAGVETCRIGLEANMTAADYPIVRLVPSLLRERTEGDPWSPLMEVLATMSAS